MFGLRLPGLYESSFFYIVNLFRTFDGLKSKRRVHTTYDKLKGTSCFGLIHVRSQSKLNLNGIQIPKGISGTFIRTIIRNHWWACLPVARISSVRPPIWSWKFWIRRAQSWICSWEVRQIHVYTRSLYIQLIPCKGGWPDLPQIARVCMHMIIRSISKASLIASLKSIQ